MNYTIFVYESAADFRNRTDEQSSTAYWGAYRAYTEALRQAGVMIGGAALQPPPTGTTIRQRDGKRHVQDGPYAEAKEQLGGYYVVEVASLDEALEWAARIPSARLGSIEVRPVMVFDAAETPA
jgi:hypothetical protein